jgi:hypothetical protein
VQHCLVGSEMCIRDRGISSAATLLKAEHAARAQNAAITAASRFL